MSLRFLLAAIVLGAAAAPAGKPAATKAPASQCGDDESCKKECDGNIPAACYKLGLLLHASDEGKDVDAAAAWTKACQGKVIAACVEAGTLYSEGKGVDADGPKAADLFKRACDAADLHGCLQLGLLIKTENGVPSNPKRAAQLLQKACDGNVTEGCVELADMYEDGTGVVKSERQGIRLLEKACSADDAAGCRILGIRYEDGLGVDDDANKALGLYKKACKQGDESGCLHAKQLAEDLGGGGEEVTEVAKPKPAATATATPKQKRGDSMLEPLPTAEARPANTPVELVDPFGADKPKATPTGPKPKVTATPDDVPDPFQ